MTTKMFHDGDLQSGIALAIQQQKLVACFIYQPNDETSKTWQEEYLTANTCSRNTCGQLGYLLSEKAVLLKIELGSQEAGFLNAFCPVGTAPALVVIQNGKVLDRIEGEIEKDDFVQRLSKAVRLDHTDEGAADNGDDTQVTEPISAQEEVLESDPLLQAEAPSDTVPPPSGTGRPSTPTGFPTHQPGSADGSQARTLLAERARRLEADRLRKEADEKAARLARQKSRQKEAEEVSAAHRQTSVTESGEKQRARDAWIYQQKQRKDEAKKEKQRILTQIESDKQERKAASLRRKEGLGEAGGYSELKGEEGAKGAHDRSIGSTSCSLQIRLFDGSSIRAKFASDADLATAVRTWVKEAAPEGGADIPYSFRQILAPQPSRSIEVGEENQSLLDLGLTPSATLVLVPVSGTVDAYSGNTGYIGSAVNGAYSLFNTAYSYAGSFLGLGTSSNNAAADSGPYMAGTGDPQEPSNVSGARMADADGGQMGNKMRVKTLADQRAEQGKEDRDATEFYNGNSSAFEGNDGKGK